MLSTQLLTWEAAKTTTTPKPTVAMKLRKNNWSFTGGWVTSSDTEAKAPLCRWLWIQASTFCCRSPFPSLTPFPVKQLSYKKSHRLINITTRLLNGKWTVLVLCFSSHVTTQIAFDITYHLFSRTFIQHLYWTTTLSATIHIYTHDRHIGSVLPKDTSTYRARDQTANLLVRRRPYNWWIDIHFFMLKLNLHT